MIYIPKSFSQLNRRRLYGLMQQNSFATLVCPASGEPGIAHLPVLIDEASDILYGHVARANPVWHEFSPDRDVLFIFHGPHHYVSPAWYTEHPSVPTWNYAVVHAHARITVIEETTRIETILRGLTDAHEATRSPRWELDLPDEYMQQMMAGIVAFEARITQLQGKFKLSQNRCADDRKQVVSALRATGTTAAVEMAELMESTVSF